jgi:hypothetical protein
MWITTPGFTDRSNRWLMGRMHEVDSHMCQNGLRSADPAIAGYARIPDLYLMAGANQCVSFNDAEEADTGTAVSPTTDRAHQSVASSIRLARHRALVLARWLEPSTAQEYEGAPYCVNAWIKSGAPDTVRVRVKITPGNRLVWTPRATEDAASVSLEQGSTTFPNDNGHIMVSAARVYTNQPASFPVRPQAIPITAIAVDNTDAASGYGYLDVTLAATPTLGSCFHIQPGTTWNYYTRKLDGTASTTTRLLTGLREEAGGTPYTVNAACADVLIPGRTFLQVLPVSSLSIAGSAPGP